MIHRPFWLQTIEEAWDRHPIVWLSGVRRVGKTVLATMMPHAVYLSCELPSARRRLADPESFYASLNPGDTAVLDEVHRLADPSSVLKIAADAFAGLRILATGSSTLAATRKFRDALTGRRSTIYLPPVLWQETRSEFGIRDLDRRLLHGGLPEPLLQRTKDPAFFAEWMDSYYARDVSELFGVRNRTGFLSLLHLLLIQSGGILDVAKLASECGMSRPTVNAHLEAMMVSHTVYAVRPYHGGGRREIVRAPKLYAFDTGFVTFARGWDSIRPEDRGVLWEHLVLDTLRAGCPHVEVRYWRDKTGREVDFVVPAGRATVDAIECNITPDRYDAGNLLRFRALYPHGRNWLACPFEDEAWERRFDDVRITIASPARIAAALRTAL